MSGKIASPTVLSTVQDVAALAARELAAFREAVADRFGRGEAERATELWLAALENTGGIEIEPDALFRHITIETAKQFATGRPNF